MDYLRFVSCAKHFWNNKVKNNCDIYSIHGFHCTQIIYIHIPKTGGLYLCKSIYGNYGLGHHFYPYYQKVFKKRISKYFVFTVVRNPYNRLISAINYLNSGGINNIHKDWKEKYGLEKDINSFLLKNLEELVSNDEHFFPQFKFIEINNAIPETLDYIGKYEDFNKVKQKINSIKKIFFPLNKINSSKKYFSVAELSNGSIKLINRLYHEDFINFNYKKR